MILNIRRGKLKTKGCLCCDDVTLTEAPRLVFTVVDTTTYHACCFLPQLELKTTVSQGSSLLNVHYTIIRA